MRIGPQISIGCFQVSNNLIRCFLNIQVIRFNAFHCNNHHTQNLKSARVGLQDETKPYIEVVHIASLSVIAHGQAIHDCFRKMVFPYLYALNLDNYILCSYCVYPDLTAGPVCTINMV